MSLFLFTSYRSVIIAFLAAKTKTLPINSYEDLLESSLGVIIYGRDDASEEFFKFSADGSVLRDIYEKKIVTERLYYNVSTLLVLTNMTSQL